MSESIAVIPANEATWEDLQAVFGTRGTAPLCQCQRFKLQPKESFGSFPAEERAARLREQTNAGDPKARTTSGLVAYLDGDPVGWCAVEPRTAYDGLLRVYRVPWIGRSEDRTDDSIRAVTCVFVRAGFRGRGISYALVRAAVDFARERGARALEGYPMITEPGREIIWDEMLVGSRNMFADASAGRDAGRVPGFPDERAKGTRWLTSKRQHPHRSSWSPDSGWGRGLGTRSPIPFAPTATT